MLHFNANPIMFPNRVRNHPYCINDGIVLAHPQALHISETTERTESGKFIPAASGRFSFCKFFFNQLNGHFNTIFALKSI
jgi:hypothetical protein